MDKSVLEQLVDGGLTQRQIATHLSVSQSSVKHWLRKHGLKTKYQPHNKGNCKQHCCKTCGETDPEKFWFRVGSPYTYCKVCDNQRVVNRLRSQKQQAVEYKGGKCTKCGYKKCQAALEFHHLDPTQKDPNWKRMRRWIFARVVEEIDKCILVCKNCHTEIHHPQ